MCIMWCILGRVQFCECSSFILNSPNSPIFWSSVLSFAVTRARNRDSPDSSVFMVMSVCRDTLCGEAAGNFEAQTSDSQDMWNSLRRCLYEHKLLPEDNWWFTDLLVQSGSLRQHLWISAFPLCWPVLASKWKPAQFTACKLCAIQ